WLDMAKSVAGAAEGDYDEHRTYVDSQTVDQGRNRDSGFAGMVVVHEIRNRRVQTSLQRRVAPMKALDRLQAQADFNHVWLPLPKAARIGEAFEVKATAMVATLFDLDGKARDVSATLTLRGPDPKSGRLRLDGVLTFLEEVKAGPVSMEARYALDVVAELDPADRRIVTLTVKGKTTVSGVGDAAGKASGEVVSETTITAKRVADPATWKAPTPKFRDNVHRELGAEFRAPSYWMQFESEDPATRRYADSRGEAGGTLIVQTVDEPNDIGTPEYLKAFAAALGVDDKSVKSATTPLGKGLTFRCPMKEDPKMGIAGRMMTLSKGRALVVKIAAPAENVAGYQAELDRIAGTFKRSAK
ncbi:MAG TPA: hypothetical protein VEI02_00400, partial [Planctomycetota bacterium]|nr:hypothetical protein [Planctomycetota bacterium]